MKYSLEFLAWVDRCMYRDDFFRELLVLGVPRLEALTLSSHVPLTILSVYQENISDDSTKDVLEKYLGYMLTKWENKK